MSKNNVDNFLAKFGNRIERIGKDGVMGIMKNTGPSINENNFIFQKELFNKNLTFKGNNNMFENNNMNLLKDINSKNPSYSLSQSYKIKNYNNYKHSNFRDANFPLNFMENNKNRKSVSSNNHYRNKIEPLVYSCQLKNNQIKNEANIFYNNINNTRKNKYEIGNNRQNIIDNGYKVYTIKDYKNIDNEVFRGKLSPNFRTKEWNKKKERMKKMSEYGKQLMTKEKGYYLKINGNKEGCLDEKKSAKLNINDNSKGESKNSINKNNEFINKKLDLNINDNNELESFRPNINVNYRRKLKYLKNILF